MVGWFVGLLAGWLVGWLTGWLAGWLVVVFFVVFRVGGYCFIIIMIMHNTHMHTCMHLHVSSGSQCEASLSPVHMCQATRKVNRRLQSMENREMEVQTMMPGEGGTIRHSEMTAEQLLN